MIRVVDLPGITAGLRRGRPMGCPQAYPALPRVALRLRLAYQGWHSTESEIGSRIAFYRQ